MPMTIGGGLAGLGAGISGGLQTRYRGIRGRRKEKRIGIEKSLERLFAMSGKIPTDIWESSYESIIRGGDAPWGDINAAMVQARLGEQYAEELGAGAKMLLPEDMTELTGPILEPSLYEDVMTKARDVGMPTARMGEGYPMTEGVLAKLRIRVAEATAERGVEKRELEAKKAEPKGPTWVQLGTARRAQVKLDRLVDIEWPRKDEEYERKLLTMPIDEWIKGRKALLDQRLTGLRDDLKIKDAEWDRLYKTGDPGEEMSSVRSDMYVIEKLIDDVDLDLQELATVRPISGVRPGEDVRAYRDRLMKSGLSSDWIKRLLRSQMD